MRKISLFILISLLIISIPSVQANNYNLDFNAELVDSTGYPLSIDDNILIDQNLAMHVKIINNNNVWINLGHFDLDIIATKDNERFYPISSTDDRISMEELLIAPNNQMNMYLVLEEYNSLDKNDRIGSWDIGFELSENTKKCFSIYDLNKENYYSVDSIKPNPINFNVVKQEAKIVNKDSKFDIIEFFEKLDPLEKVVTIVGGFLGIIASCLFIINYIKEK